MLLQPTSVWGKGKTVSFALFQKRFCTPDSVWPFHICVIVQKQENSLEKHFIDKVVSDIVLVSQA